MREAKDRDAIIRLFLPFDNKTFPVRNRFVRAATWLGAAGDDGRATDVSTSRQIQAAAGGAGTVISEFAYISPDGKALPKQWGMASDAAVEDVRRLALGVHSFGSKLIVQICHAGGGREETGKSGLRPLSPSGLDAPSGGASKAMTKEDIARVCRDFAAAARRAKKGGADGVEIHAAHGFLLTQFMSPLLNKREDEYGGSFENRFRLTREVYSSVRAAVGDDFSVWLKISASEGVPGGYGADEGTEAALTLLSDGANVAEISSGTNYGLPSERASMVGVSAGESEAPFAPYAAKIKSRAPRGSLVLLTGGLRSLPVMAALLEDGAADLFGLSRPFISEPDLINRWAEDDARPSACISCNACFKTASRGVVDCPVMRDREEGEWDAL